MFLKEISFENFKGIKEGSVKLNKFTLFFGRNNSGKTTICEAIFLAQNPFREVPLCENSTQLRAIEVLAKIHRTLESSGYVFLLRNYVEKLARINYDTGIGKYSIVFELIQTYDTMHNRKFEYISVYIEGDVVERLPERYNPKPERYYAPMGRLSKVEDKIVSLNIGNVLAFNNLTVPIMFIRYDLLKCYWNFLDLVWSEIINEDITTKVAQRIFGNGYDITIEPYFGGRKTIYVFSKGRRIRLGDWGNGIQVITIFLILYYYLRPKVIVWDDVELHMNPTLLMQLLNILSEIADFEDVQVILTTHSLEVIKIIAKMFENDNSFVGILTELREGKLLTREFTASEILELSKTLDLRVIGVLL